VLSTLLQHCAMCSTDSDDRPYIVEMTWGQSSRATVYAYADNGGLLGVTVIRSREPPDPVRRRFYCTRELWYEVLALARRCGWLPMGTIPAVRCKEEWERRGRFNNSYDPDTWLYAKQLEAADTAELANALERALEDWVAAEIMRSLSTLLRGAWVGDGDSKPVHHRMSREFLHEFIGFLRKGPFELTLVAAAQDGPQHG